MGFDGLKSLGEARVMTHSLAMATAVELRDSTGAKAIIHPVLGGWLTRYGREVPGVGWVDAFHHDDAVVARYPDRMWAGNPVLFPHVSYNFHEGQEGAYAVEGQVYRSPQHGFARRVPWAVVEQTDNALVMELTDSEVSRTSYPFRFRHRLAYTLISGRLIWLQAVTNLDARPMPFSTGFHPYLPVPLTPGGARNDCRLRIPGCRRYTALPQASAFTSSPLPAGHLPMTLDYSEAWFLGDFETPQVALQDPGSGVEVVVDFGASPFYRYLALWSRGGDCPFFCVEPWTALPNVLGRKDGERIELQPGETFHATIWMDVQRF